MALSPRSEYIPKRSKMPVARFLRFAPPIDRSRCLANALRQIYKKGSFEQIGFYRLNGKNHLRSV